MREDPSFASLTQDYRLLLEIAAVPRPTGGDAIAAARARCALELHGMGFQVRERRFAFSEFPGRFATPLFGAAGAFVVGAAGHLGSRGARLAPLIVTAAGVVALFLAGRWMARRGVLSAPVLRREGVNIEATRGRETPAVWLCAHLDTKSQPVPTLLRSAGIVLEALGVLATLGLAIAAALGAFTHPYVWAAAAIVTLVGAIPVVLSVVGSRSPGALDNASGVATVLATTRQLGDRRGFGVLITDAEELGLAGARAWASESRSAIVLNCDGVDDTGGVKVMFTGKRPTGILDAVSRASSSTGVAHQAARLAAGILTDSVAFTDAGMSSVTFSLGSLKSLARVHSSRDDLAHLRGAGIPEVASLMAATVRELR